MMKRLLMTTAAASLLALGSAAYAQDTTTTQPAQPPVTQPPAANAPASNSDNTTAGSANGGAAESGRAGCRQNDGSRDEIPESGGLPCVRHNLGLRLWDASPRVPRAGTTGPSRGFVIQITREDAQ